MYNTSLALATRAARFRSRLTFGALVFFAFFRLILLPEGEGLPLFSSWLADSAVFLTLLLIARILQAIPGGRIVSRLFFHSAYLLYFVLTFSYCYFFREATIRQYSIFDLTLSGIAYFFTNVLPFWGNILLLAALLLVYVVSYLRDDWHIPTTLAFLLCGSLFMVAKATANENASPILHLIQDVSEAARSPGLTVDPAPTEFSLDDLDSWTHPAPRFEPRFQKIIVLVMEQITLAQLREDSRALPHGTFFNREEEHSHEYNNFFAADMDSRTGMLALLGGRLIPFEAYSDEDVDQYSFVSGKPSLLNIVKNRNYRTVYSASETERELVVTDLPWDQIYTLTHEEVDQARSKYLCINPYEFEHSCEDKIMVSRLVNDVVKHDRVFLFYEFIFGHASEYIDIQKKTAVQYYSEFIDDLISGLRKAHELDQTLIVVTSDHGIRDHGYESWLSTYRIPLLFYHPSFKKQLHPELHSQIDFRDIFLEESSGKPSSLKSRKFAVFMGTTTSSIVGAITDQGDVMVLKNRKWLPYVMFNKNADEEDAPGGPPKSDLKPGAVVRYIQDYRAKFLSGNLPAH